MICVPDQVVTVERLQQAMQERRMSLSELALKSRVNRNTIHGWFKGRKPSSHCLGQVSAALDVPLAWMQGTIDQRDQAGACKHCLKWQAAFIQIESILASHNLALDQAIAGIKVQVLNRELPV
jgi:transcriptional regulator with XRE-family HTH domain